LTARDGMWPSAWRAGAYPASRSWIGAPSAVGMEPSLGEGWLSDGGLPSIADGDPWTWRRHSCSRMPSWSRYSPVGRRPARVATLAEAWWSGWMWAVM